MRVANKLDKTTHKTLLKALLIGALAYILLVLFYEALFSSTQNQLHSLLLAFLDPIIFEPLVLFLVSYLICRKYFKYIKFKKHSHFHLGVYVLLGWYASFNIVEIINQKALVFYVPSLLTVASPMLGSYLGSKKL